MNCYNFEENITKFIDNELKQDFRSLFLDHRDGCEKCNKKLESINNNITILHQLPLLKTSDDFLNGLNQKIYDYNNNPSIWERIKSIKFFELPRIYAVGYVATLFLAIFSSYSLLNMDTTDYNKINQKVITSLKENSQSQNLPQIDENYGLGELQLADANIPSQNKKQRIHQKHKTINQPIMPVSSNNNSNKRNILNQRRNVPRQNNLSSQIISNTNNLKIDNYNQNKEEYIIDYENKNRYYQKRKDSLKSMLNNNLDRHKKISIQEQIKKDSLEQLEYYRSFDKIQKTED